MAAGLLDRYIAAGFKDDCMTLLSKFADTNSARFSDFVKVWQEMKFSTVYCGLNTFAELLEFTEEALCISKHLFLPPNHDISRIGALYLLYGVYTQQPTRGLVKIRMTPDDWIHTINFVDNIREFGYADANFIFHSLCYSAAFTFTISSKEYGLERSYRRHQITSTHMREMMQCKNLTTNQLLKPAFEDIDVEELEKMRESYENCKNIIQRKEEKQGMEFTSVTPGEGILATLRGIVDPFISDQADANTSKTTPSAGSHNESLASSSKNIGKGRQELKKRAYKQQTLGQNHLRSCLSTTEDVEPQTEAPATSEGMLAERSQGGSTQVESLQAEITDSQEKLHKKKNIFFSEKKRKKVTKVPPHGENLFPITSSVDDNVDLSEPSNSMPPTEMSSTSNIPVRKSSRLRKAPAKMRLADTFFKLE